MTADLTTGIEDIGLVTCQPVDRTVATIQNQNKIGAALLLRHLVDGGFFWLCFLFGNSKWRRRRSMHVGLLRFRLPGAESLLSGRGNLVEISCTCKTFSLAIDCEHVTSTTANLENKIRLMTIL